MRFMSDIFVVCSFITMVNKKADVFKSLGLCVDPEFQFITAIHRAPRKGRRAQWPNIAEFYELYNIIDGENYVGHTTIGLAGRLKTHKRDATAKSKLGFKLYRHMNVVGRRKWHIRFLGKAWCKDYRAALVLERKCCDIIQPTLNVNRPAVTAAEKNALRATPKRKAAAALYATTPKRKASLAAYGNTPKRKASKAAYEKTHKRKRQPCTVCKCNIFAKPITVSIHERTAKHIRNAEKLRLKQRLSFIITHYDNPPSYNPADFKSLV